ncbi:hypothetical protein SEA_PENGUINLOVER67_55 [Mycobacterium phage PenguinLover67]|nr:hypothetical protein SEA_PENGUINLOVER67_55 [Mycobacterium phage PenguinLover67]
MSRADDIEAVKRAADGQRGRPATLAESCSDDSHELGCQHDHPLEEALRAAEATPTKAFGDPTREPGGVHPAWTEPGHPEAPRYAMGGPIGLAKDARPERERILEEARRAISGERQRDYGPPTASFERIGKMWAAILGLDEVTAEQYAMCMAAVKIGRLIESPNHRDSWMDLAGYAALGAEVAATEGRYL